MDWFNWEWFQQFWPTLILPMIPILGKALLAIPFVANKAIPFVLFVFNTAAKYWMLAGFPVESEPTPEPPVDIGSGEPEIMLAGWFGKVGGFVWSVIWAGVEQVIGHTWYEGRKGLARANGTVSFWEKHKNSMY